MQNPKVERLACALSEHSQREHDYPDSIVHITGVLIDEKYRLQVVVILIDVAYGQS